MAMSFSPSGRSGTFVKSPMHLLGAVCITGRIEDTVVDIPVDNFVDKSWVWPARWLYWRGGLACPAH